MNSARPRIEPATAQFDERGTPYSARYADVYHSAQSGPGQSRHVFLAGNQLPERWRGRQRFVVLETGFGLGLNFLVTWRAWREDLSRPGRLHYVAVERHPFERDGLERLHAAFPELDDLARQLRSAWPMLVPGMHRIEFESGRLVLDLVFDDAERALLRIEARADAFFLDGFAPSRNPAMWSRAVLRRLPALAARDATLATYTVAGRVVDELSSAGFQVERSQGFAGKRQMLSGRLRPALGAAARGLTGNDRRAMVIGAGFAGAFLAYRMSRRGWQVTLVDAAQGPAAGASGLPGAAFHPHVSVDDARLSRLTRTGFLSLLRDLNRVGVPGARPPVHGLIQLAGNPAREAVMADVIRNSGFPDDYLRWLDRSEAARHLGWRPVTGGWWYPGGGWLAGSGLVTTLLECSPGIHTRFGRTVSGVRRIGAEWALIDAAGAVIGTAPWVVLANACDGGRLAGYASLMRRIRGRLTQITAQAIGELGAVVTGPVMLIPEAPGRVIIGATYQVDAADDGGSDSGADRENLERMAAMFPGMGEHVSPDALSGHSASRCTFPDRMPAFGRVPLPQGDGTIDGSGGVFAAFGLGSRGLTLAGLGAELLVSQMDGDPLPIETDLVAAMDPLRLGRPVGAEAGRWPS